jgi:hypothetical protein
LGANGIWLQGIQGARAPALDAGVGTQRSGAHGAVNLSLGATAVFAAKYRGAIAIYEPPAADRRSDGIDR